MQLKNQTGCVRAEEFIRREAGRFETQGLAVLLKRSRDKGSVLGGSFRARDPRIVATVNPAAKLPTSLRFPVRTELRPTGHYRLGYVEAGAATFDELMVWAFFHEFHHFLCHTRQRKGSWHSNTRASAYAFETLRKFKNDGAASTPPEPPRPETNTKLQQRTAGAG